MFHVEIGKALRRWRTWLLAAALAGVPVLIVIAVKASDGVGSKAWASCLSASAWRTNSSRAAL